MTTQTVFRTWRKAGEAGFYTRSAWRRRFRRGIKPKADPLHALIEDAEEQKVCRLYSKEQTTRMTHRVWARNYLLDLFVGHPDKCKITTVEQQFRELKKEDLWWGTSIRPVIERAFNYKATTAGILTGVGKVEGFHIYGQPKTRFCVIDLDLHSPTKEQAAVHLDLVAGIEQRLPIFLKQISAKTAFYQYRHQPTGIQIWIVTKHRWEINQLHDYTRMFLESLGEDLDQRLVEVGLPALNRIEILPAQNHTVSMAGIHGKEIFTNRILKPKDGRCDVIGLADHIYTNQPPGEILDRYKRLLEATLLVSPEDRPQIKVEREPVRKKIQSQTQQGYVTELFKKAREGVTVPDCLFHEYLAPLAQFLYFRDLRNSPSRSLDTKKILGDWIQKKHNGNVDRINRKKFYLVESQISRVVDQLEKKTGKSLMDWFNRIQLMDVRYPHRYKSLIDEMGVRKDSFQPFLLTNCKWDKKSHTKSGNDLRKKRNKLPRAVNQKLAKTTLKTAKSRNRLKLFAARLLPMLYPAERSLSADKINKLLELQNRRGALSYKKELVRLNLIKANWDRGIIRGKRSSVYALTEWAAAQFEEMVLGENEI